MTSVAVFLNSSRLLLLSPCHCTSSTRGCDHSPSGAERDVADNGLERVALHVVGDLVLVGALGRLDRLAEDLQIGVGKGRQVPAQRVDPSLAGFRLIFLEEIEDAGK